MWMTASGRNNDHFAVEHSDDGVDWSVVLTVPGALDSQAQLRYTSEDLLPLPGTLDYRLCQTDVDGASSISDMVAVYLALFGSVIRIYPDPGLDRATLMYDEAIGSVTIMLVNGLGQPIAVDPARNQGRVEVDLSAVPEGMYLVVLSTASSAFRERLLVQH